MKALVSYTVSTQQEYIDLSDYGHKEDATWEDLTDEQQHEIEDTLRDQNVILVTVSGIKDDNGYCNHDSWERHENENHDMVTTCLKCGEIDVQ